MTAIKKEVSILEHLQGKINEAHHDHKFTENQRTIKELLAYLAATPWKITELLFTWNMWVFADMKTYNESFQVTDFVSTLHTNANNALEIINSATEEQLAEKVELFEWRVQGTRAQLLVESVYAQMVAYKMQLFLQMKHAGLKDINSMNLWAGMDTPSA